MRCSSFCTANNYDMSSLKRSLKAKGYSPQNYDEVIHINVDSGKHKADVFFFPFGCVVSWGLGEEEEKKYYKLPRDFQEEDHKKVIEDYAVYKVGKVTEIKEEYDEIVLEKDDILVKLSISFGLAQSVKLSSFEESIVKTIENTRHIPNELVQKGKISLSSTKLSKKLGALFQERNSINLHTEIIGVPEFFWRRPMYEPYYLMTAEYLDIKIRLDILNKRLDVIHELYDMISNELKHIHSSRLELTIIYLIIIEVVLVLIKDFFKWI